MTDEELAFWRSIEIDLKMANLLIREIQAMMAQDLRKRIAAHIGTNDYF